MIMSLFTQRQPTRQLDHLACILLASNPQAMEMVLFAHRYRQDLSLVVIEGQTTIIKVMEVGDDKLSFESLYDHCITPRNSAADGGCQGLYPRCYHRRCSRARS